MDILTVVIAVADNDSDTINKVYWMISMWNNLDYFVYLT